MEIIDIRTGKISYTVTNNNVRYSTDKSILIEFNNYTWIYTIDLESDKITLCLCVDKDNNIEDKRDHIRTVVENCTTINQLREFRVHKYSFTRKLLDNLYNEIKNKCSVHDIPEQQNIEFYNKIIDDYIELWNYIMN